MQRRRILALASVLALGACTPSGATKPVMRALSSPSTTANVPCPLGASPERSRCSCRADLRPVAGACVSPAVAAAHCGPSAIAGPEGCAPLPSCERGRARDLASGTCLPRREVRALATSLGILVADDEVLTCPKSTELSFAGADAHGGPPLLACVARAAQSDAHRVEEHCPAGSVSMPSPTPAAPAASGCSSFLEAGRASGEVRVDVVRWLHAVVGREGAPGAPLLCGALARSPSALGAPAAGDRLFVSLDFRDNDVSQVVADVHAVGPSGATDVVATTELAAAFAPLVEALRSLGGTASEAAASTVVRCGSGSGSGAAPERPKPEPGAAAENDVRR